LGLNIGFSSLFVLRLGLGARVVLGLVLVDLLEELEGGVLNLIGLVLELSTLDLLASLGTGNNLTESSNLLSDLVSLSLVNLGLELVQGVLGLVADRVSTVGVLNGLTASLILLLVLLGIVNHVLDLSIRKTRRTSNSDRGILVGTLILGRNVDDTIGINVKGDLNLGNTLGGRGDTREGEVTNELVVTDQLTLTLVDTDLNGGLASGSSREDLGLLGGNGGVSVNQSGEDTTEGLNTERKGSNIKEKNVLNLTGKNGTLNGSTNGNSLIGVDRLIGLLAEERLDGLGDLGHTGHTTDEDDLINLVSLKTSILKGLLDGVNSALDQRVSKTLELRSGNLGVNVLGASSIGSDERKVNLSSRGRRQLNLSLLSSLSDTLNGHTVVLEVNVVLLLELLNKVTDNDDIEILTTKMGITVGRLDLENTLLDLKDGDIEGTTTKIENSNDLVVGLLKTVGKGSSSGLVNDTEDVHANNLTSILGGLSLGVIEVGRDGNNGVLDGLAKVSLSGLLHLVKDETTNLSGRVLLTAGLEPGITVGVLDNLVGDLLDILLDLSILESTTNQTLGGKKSVLGVDNGLTLGSNTDKTLTVLGESNNGGGGSSTLSVLDDLGDLAFHDGNGRVGGTQIDTDNGTLDLGRVESSLDGGS